MTARTWRTWTHRGEQRLIELRNAGCTRQQIADDLGRTFGSVANRLQQMGIVWERPLSDLTLALIRPHKVKDVARRFGITRWAVSKAKREMRLRGVGVWYGRPRPRRAVA
jgi:predicted transcriptional regulator